MEKVRRQEKDMSKEECKEVGGKGVWSMGTEVGKSRQRIGYRGLHTEMETLRKTSISEKLVALKMD